jgi:UDP-glucose 4-epimerase
MYCVDAVIHFAGLKAVGESVEKPLDYYINNVSGSCTLFKAMRAHAVMRIVFSSSATVYDPNAEMPLKETSLVAPVNPYGRTKLMIEEILRDISEAEPKWHHLSLRYFNPAGAHESGLIGESPRNMPNNLMPYVAQVAVGRLPRLRIFGNDYPTGDGTGVRDYVHVTDLAIGHLAALQRLLANVSEGESVINLGTGHGHTVLEVVEAFARTSERPICYDIVERRPGDVACSFAEVAVASRVLGWKAERDLERMCRDTWRWQVANPHGYSFLPGLL